MKLLATLWAVLFLAVPIVPVVAGGPEAAAGDDALELGSRIEPGRQVTLSPVVGGRVVRVHVEVGQRVKAGELLCELDDVRLKIALERAELQLEGHQVRKAAADTRAQTAAAQLEMVRELAERSAIAQRELLSAEQEQELARLEQRECKIELRLASLAVEAARHDLESTRLLAPFDGTISRLDAAPGAVIEAGRSLGELIDTSRMQAVVYLRLPDARRFRGRLAAASVTVTGADADTIARGRLASIAPVLDPVSAHVQAVVEFDGQGEEFIPGEPVTVRIVTADPQE
jgi:RND family efflux transporter MFP subunit